jgi:D-alanine-D-alanine ligase
MASVRVGVVRGGPSSEYEVSLKTGGAVLGALSERYQGHDILITRDGTWHYQGLPSSPDRKVDVFFNALHGEYGEDGKLQSLLEHLGVPYTGSGTFASAVGMNKVMAKDIFRRAGLKVAHGVLVRRGEHDDAARWVFNKVRPPWVVKPADRGSSVGLFLVKTFAGLTKALADAFGVSKNVLVEEFIPGRESTVGVVNHFRGHDTYALPPIEIRRPHGTVWGYDDKYSGQIEELCPAPSFTTQEKLQLENLAVRAHEALGLRHYSRSDFILSPRGIYILETNTLPGMTPTSLLPKALSAVGCNYPDFLDHVLTLALERR